MLRKSLTLFLIITLATLSLSQHLYAGAVDAYLDTDKDERSLGDDLTIFVADPDVNIDSRTIERIPLNTVFIDTNKFGETPLDSILARTGISASHPFLQETGFNTGIFAITLESINSKLVDRGSQIRIIYFDNTPSGGGSPVRIQTVVPVVEAKIAVIFDRKEYSLFDQIEIKVIAQMFNANRNKMDTLNTPTGSRVAVTTSSGQTYYPPMFETGISTGVFVGKVQLTPDQNEKNGDLVVTSGDRIKVSILIVPGFEVSDLAAIIATIGSITFDRSEYSVGDTVKVIVTDNDENRDSNVSDTIRVKIWSNTDISGIELMLQETETASGVFEGMLTLSAERSTGESLVVEDNDIVIGVYKDRTVPSLTETIAMKDLFVTASIGSITTGIMTSDPLVLDQNDRSVSSIEVGAQTTIQVSITNAKTMEEAFVYVIHIKDSDGFTSQLSFITGMLNAYQSISIGRLWTPDTEGMYTIEVFTWNSLTEPTAFSPMKKSIAIVK